MPMPIMCVALLVRNTWRAVYAAMNLYAKKARIPPMRMAAYRPTPVVAPSEVAVVVLVDA
jgi:hypothetical protein